MNENLTFERSQQGFKNQMDECIEVISLGVVFTDLVKIESFYTVIAAQLRLLLCDTSKRGNQIIDNSLILKVFDNPKFPPLSNDYQEIDVEDSKGKFINRNNVFDKQAEPIELNTWLEQRLYSIDNDAAITIFDVIKFYANKNGGAHVDSQVTGRELFAIMMAENYLNDIAKCVMEQLEYDWQNIAGENINKLYSKLNEIYQSN